PRALGEARPSRVRGGLTALPPAGDPRRHRPPLRGGAGSQEGMMAVSVTVQQRDVGILRAPWLRVHAMPSIAMLAFCAWLTRRWIFTSGIPAGTDMLGFISRAGQNAPGLRALSIWNPNSFGGLRQFTLESG